MRRKYLDQVAAHWRNYYTHFRSVQYINKDLAEEFYTISAYSESLYKKVLL